ncbi:MAG: ABC transporter substrate-binding protein [Alphaproteobacteria bacterium]|jgi:putative thiamine transport system substrate-binding protein
MKRLTAALLAALLALFASAPAGAQGADWPAIVAKAKGQTVYWNAWAGDEKINAYIAWVGERVSERYGVTVQHVKLGDTAEAVARVVAEKAAGRDSGGSVDLIWINGENFAAMKRNGLLYGPWTQALPNYALVDLAGKPTTRIDFTVPVDGLEAPWGMAQVVFMYDTAHVPEPPRSIPDLLTWASTNPGRFTYPQPPNFLGTTFLKQVLIELVADPSVLQYPVDKATFDAVTAPLWQYLDVLHPLMWRTGLVFPANSPEQIRLMDDGEISIAISFNPSEASSRIASGDLPDTVRTFVLEGGTIGNTNFVAIPFNAKAREGAMVVANFLLSPEAQARKQNPEYWGGFTVLDLAKLSPAQRALFDDLPLGVATLSPDRLGKTLLEPHPSWVGAIEAEWARRYASGR